MEIDKYLDRRFGNNGLLDQLRGQFEGADPFPWLVLENFLIDEFARQLVADFPASGSEYERFCVGDDGKPGPNYANPELSSFPNAFRVLDSLLASTEFLVFLQRITGIPDLEYD